MSDPATASPEPSEPPRPVQSMAERQGPPWRDRMGDLAVSGVRVVGRGIVVVVLGAILLFALVIGGLYMSPIVSAAAPPAELSSRRPPIVPPSVPVGAREDWAVWSYVDKINQAWGRDWPLVIQWFEELDARYPGNPMVLDKLYVSYLEDGRARLLRNDIPGARQRFDQAARYDPDRGVAQEMLAELDAATAPRR